MTTISVQVSLYPLGKDHLSQAIDLAIDIFQRHSLGVVFGPMSTLITGDDAAVFSALQEAFQHALKEGRVVMVATFSNACPILSDKDSKIEN